jgi:hypothetical protein
MRNKKAFLSFVFVSITGLFVFETPSLAGKLVIQDYVVKVRKAPSLVGPSVGELKHNDTVDEIERRNNFVKIKTRGLEGWVPLSAVTSEKKLTVKKGNKIRASDDSDVLAAGKGLGDSSREISESKANAARGEKYLDEVEKNTETRDSDITKFKVKGGLKPGQQEKTGK